MKGAGGGISNKKNLRGEGIDSCRMNVLICYLTFLNNQH